MTLTLRNRHPTRSANVTVHVDVDGAEGGFVVAGARAARVPVLLPSGDEHVLRWNLIPVECGVLRLPPVRVLDRRKPFVAGQQGAGPEVDLLGEPVKVIDVRWDVREADETTSTALQRAPSADSDDSEEAIPRSGMKTVLILPG
jgi:trafficking protein particle complex subunit 11